MAINASHIVQVRPNLLSPAGTNLEFNGLLLTKNEAIPSGQGMVIPFSDATQVAEYFGYESDEYKLASIYFQGYTGSLRTPRAFYIARRIDADIAPFIRGGASATIDVIKAVVDGEITLTLGTHSATLTGIDFATAGTFSDAATILQEKIRAHVAGGESWTNATVTYSSQLKSFTITGGQIGADYAVDYAAGNVSDALSLTKAKGATLSQGADFLTDAEQMDAIVGVTKNWVTFTTLWKATHQEMIAYATWATGQGINFLYAPWDDDPALLQKGNTTTSAHALKEANVGATAMWWGSAKYAVFMAGVAASIDWEKKDGIITFAFKAQEGLPASVSSIANAKALESQGVNYIGDFATRNDQFIISYTGGMFGEWKWIDTYVSAVWFFNALQTALMAGLKISPRVPYTEKGYGLVRSWIQDPVNKALNNGAISPGVTLSQSQKTQVNREAGLDIANTLESEGFFIQILNPSPSVRTNRESPEVHIWYTDAGAVHKLDVTATALN